jgi:hypothetical protein
VDVYLRLVWHLPGFGRLTAEDGSVLDAQRPWFPSGGNAATA